MIFHVKLERAEDGLLLNVRHCPDVYHRAKTTRKRFRTSKKQL